MEARDRRLPSSAADMLMRAAVRTQPPCIVRIHDDAPVAFDAVNMLVRNAVVAPPPCVHTLDWHRVCRILRARRAREQTWVLRYQLLRCLRGTLDATRLLNPVAAARVACGRHSVVRITTPVRDLLHLRGPPMRTARLPLAPRAVVLESDVRSSAALAPLVRGVHTVTVCRGVENPLLPLSRLPPLAAAQLTVLIDGGWLAFPPPPALRGVRCVRRLVGVVPIISTMMKSLARTHLLSSSSAARASVFSAWLPALDAGACVGALTLHADEWWCCECGDRDALVRAALWHAAVRHRLPAAMSVQSGSTASGNVRLHTARGSVLLVTAAAQVRRCNASP